MAKESERMRLLKENFMELHQQGFSIPEIAEKYNLGSAAIYSYALQSIADANGVSRQSLLKTIRKPTEREHKEEDKKVKANVTELKNGFREAEELLDTLINTINETLREGKKHDNYEE